MHLILESSDLNGYLKATDIVDHHSREIRKLAGRLMAQNSDEIQLARAAYKYVRDNIAHSFDINGKTVTCRASDVLKYGEGICYAKAILLAAVLRCCGIPAGFCYQKLVMDDDQLERLVLHGLNAVYLRVPGRWIRIDARGNKPGVDAEFNETCEKLAFPVRPEMGETDYPMVYLDPSPKVVEALRSSQTMEQLLLNLPTDL